MQQQTTLVGVQHDAQLEALCGISDLQRSCTHQMGPPLSSATVICTPAELALRCYVAQHVSAVAGVNWNMANALVVCGFAGSTPAVAWCLRQQ